MVTYNTDVLDRFYLLCPARLDFNALSPGKKVALFPVEQSIYRGMLEGEISRQLVLAFARFW